MPEIKSLTKKQSEISKNQRHVGKDMAVAPQSYESGPISLLIGETPFLPPMEKHVRLLSSSQSSEQRFNFAMQLQQTYGNRYVERLMRTITVQEKPVTHQEDRVAPPLSIENKADPEKQVVDKILSDVAQGGITFAAYVPPKRQSGKKVSGGAEFKNQANQFAVDHGALGMIGNKVTPGIAMEMSEGLSARFKSLMDGIEAMRGKYPELKDKKIKVNTVAIFTHGEKNQLEAAAKGEWIMKSLDAWVKGIAPYLSPSPRVLLYACLTADKPAKGIPFAEALAGALKTELEGIYGEEAGVSPTVWGHQKAAHTTSNPRFVVFGETAGGVSLLGQLSGKMAELAISRANTGAVINEKQRAKILSAARKSLERDILAVAQQRTRPGDPLNVYVREIPQMGLDRVWKDLTSTDEPDFSDLKITDTARIKVKDGLKEFRKRFTKALEKLQKSVPKPKPKSNNGT